ncbi:rhomboid family intramembrane serine protease [Vulgatibacter incomptus]|uniref:Rhomboid family serine protease n=1 Tax=Vulgatibacter incomptus TaxID=1391653 RepID=A0A0K1PCP0_9BACT|nr:rhomboid family intramembrane serine protease [Vulgatibacter incomptus]AKU91267.1 rhomboid family serine protease [Vulgatibacter incomptus]
MNQPSRISLLGSFPATSGILALLIAAFIIEVLSGGSQNGMVLARLGANYTPLVLEGGQWWRLVTATLLHIGPVHLLMNGWALWQLGRLSEITFGSATTLALFVFTGITGSALTLLTVKLSAGASGAIFGLEGALIAFFLRHRDHLTPQGKSLLKQLLAWSAFMIAYGFAVPNIDWMGHFGGLGGGLAVGWLLQPRTARTGLLAKGAGLVGALVLVGAIALAVASPPLR